VTISRDSQPSERGRQAERTTARQGEATAPPLATLRLPITLAVAVGLTTLAITVWYGDALLPEIPTLRQAGPLTSAGLPVLKFAMNAAAVITVGWLLMAAVFLPAADAGRLSEAGRQCLRSASVSAAAWALTGLAVATFAVSDLLGRSIPEVVIGDALVGYFVDLPEGWALLAIIIAAAILSVVAHLPKTPSGAGYLLVIAVAALTPLVFTGHAAAAASHATAVFSLALHVVAAGTWVGGLLVLLVSAGWLGDRLPVVVPRFSGLALVCFAAVAGSGLVNAWIRLGGLNLESPYAKLVVAKTVAIAGLGLFGWWHRRVSLPALRSGRGKPAEGTARRRNRVFLRIAGAEVVLMAATIALATGLSRTPTPLLATPLEDSAEYVLGFDLPGPPSVAAYALAWWPDWLFISLVAAGAMLYAVGLVRLRRRGIGWPISRGIAWYVGLALLLVITSGGMARYSVVIFSAHMAQHIIMSTLVPIPLILGAPVTLALRTLGEGGGGTDGSGRAGRSPRELFAALVRSRAVRILAHPLVALPVFAAGLYGFYLSPLFEVSLGDHALHSLSLMAFLITGVFFLWPIIGGPDAPYGLDGTIKFVLLLVIAPVHAFFGISLMWSQGVLAEDWYGFLTRAWGPSVLDDQQFGGMLAWMIGLGTTLLAILLLAYQQLRNSARSSSSTE
jgi:cytochrome c oxidase assembly factor CtaG/putative copper export protein